MTQQAKKQPLPKLGPRLLQARQARKMSQQAVGDAVGTPHSQVSLWESGKCRPSAEHLVELARTLNVSLDWLMGLSNRGGPGDVVKHRRCILLICKVALGIRAGKSCSHATRWAYTPIGG
jgi:transcriptional regulator with XRE-family HTH domain